MSNWITITADDVLTIMAGAELAAVREQALGDGQTDPLASTISEIVQLVRGYVSKAFTLSTGETVPRKLRGATLILVRDRLLSRLPITDLSNADRTAQTNNAWRLLRDVAAGTFDVDQPDTPITTETSPAAPVQLIHVSRSHFSGHQLDGL